MVGVVEVFGSFGWLVLFSVLLLRVGVAKKYAKGGGVLCGDWVFALYCRVM